MSTYSRGRRAIARLAIVVRAALVVIAAASGAAGAASIAYIDGGDVWLSSLDGQQKVRLATPVVNAGGQTEPWLAVAALRTVAASSPYATCPGGARFSRCSRSGSRTARPRSRGRWMLPAAGPNTVYPQGFDVTTDGANMVYGYLNHPLRAVGPPRRGGDLCPARDQQLTRAAIDESSGRRTQPSSATGWSLTRARL